MRVEPLLRHGIARMAQRPVGGQPVLEKRRITAFGQVQHEIGAQAAEQLLAVVQVGANLRFQLPADTWQQQFLQIAAVGLVQRRVDRLALIQAAPAQPGHLIFRREHLGRRIARVQSLERT